MHNNLALFRKKILYLFNDEINCNFKINCVYYLHLLDPNGHVLVAIPFILYSKYDDEDLIEYLYNELLPFLQKYLSDYEKYNVDYFITYINFDKKNYIYFKNITCYKKKREYVYPDVMIQSFLQLPKNIYLEEICLF